MCDFDYSTANLFSSPFSLFMFLVLSRVGFSLVVRWAGPAELQIAASSYMGWDENNLDEDCSYSAAVSIRDPIRQTTRAISELEPALHQNSPLISNIARILKIHLLGHLSPLTLISRSSVQDTTTHTHSLAASSKPSSTTRSQSNSRTTSRSAACLRASTSTSISSSTISRCWRRSSILTWSVLLPVSCQNLTKQDCRLTICYRARSRTSSSAAQWYDTCICRRTRWMCRCWRTRRGEVCSELRMSTYSIHGGLT